MKKIKDAWNTPRAPASENGFILLIKKKKTSENEDLFESCVHPEQKFRAHCNHDTIKTVEVLIFW